MCTYGLEYRLYGGGDTIIWLRIDTKISTTMGISWMNMEKPPCGEADVMRRRSLSETEINPEESAYFSSLLGSLLSGVGVMAVARPAVGERVAAGCRQKITAGLRNAPDTQR